MFNIFKVREKTKKIFKCPRIEDLLADHKKFNDFVYTPAHKAITELEFRRKDNQLEEKIGELLNHDVPEFLIHGKPKAVLFRQISTPNNETRRFFSILDSLNELEPFLGEHRDDRFTTNNEYKNSWGKVLFNRKQADERFENIKIINPLRWDGKPLSEIETLWGQKLIEFHHELFEKTYRPVNTSFFHNISPWLAKHGGSAKNYYGPVLSWFLKHGILFENFMIGNGKEHSFTKDIFLPAFISVYETTGFKPLIVNLLPTTIEGAHFWLCHPHTSQEYFKEKMLNVRDTI